MKQTMPEANVQEMLEEKESELRTRKYIGPFTKVVVLSLLLGHFFNYMLIALVF